MAVEDSPEEFYEPPYIQGSSQLATKVTRFRPEESTDDDIGCSARTLQAVLSQLYTPPIAS